MNDDDKGTPLVPDDAPEELTPEQMILPTRAELEARKGEEKKDEPTTNGEDKPKNDKTDKGDEGGDKAEPPVESEPTDPEEVELVQALTDPGDYKAQDYSFKVTVYDQEGKNGKVHTIKSVEQWDELLDTEPNLGSGGAVLKADRAAAKMERQAEQDLREHEEAKTAYKEQQEAVTSRNETLKALVGGMNYLTEKGKLPKIAAKYQNANWNDPEVAKQPGVKEQLELLAYMAKENKIRTQAGIPPFASVVDAHTQFLSEHKEATATQQDKDKAEQRRKNGSRISGPSPSPTNATPKGVMVGRNLGDLSKLDQLM